ncbi:MAG: twitching motility protein PilT [Fibrobacter sp.]|nr:twitching motility protein PilT [Fibrobacter sp.]
MNNNKNALFCFHGSLIDFLSSKLRKVPLIVSFDSSASIKDIIESCGVPHPEVDSIAVNNCPVDFAFHPGDNDRIDVYPFSFSSNLPYNLHLQPALPQPLSFILDVHLGKLARFLRMMGFDSIYSNNFEDKEIVSIASEKKRIVLTRDIGILKYRLVTWGYWVRSTKPFNQYIELVNRYNLCSQAKPFSICINCNGVLIPAEKEILIDRLEPNTKRYYSVFKQCISCGNVYWEGSHMEKMKSVIKTICTNIKTGV